MFFLSKKLYKFTFNEKNFFLLCKNFVKENIFIFSQNIFTFKHFYFPPGVFCKKYMFIQSKINAFNEFYLFIDFR